MNKSFIDFYNNHNVLPVRQKIDDPRFKECRSHLYSQLGVPLRFIRGMEVLEFGPGGGFNATATSQYIPSEFHFVEGSDLGVKQLSEFIQRKKITAETTRIYHSDFLAFNLAKKFDLVIAEACIPGQINPEKYLKHISNFVRESGILIITTTSMSSMLSEILRALFGYLIKDYFDSLGEYQNFLESKIDSHLYSLGSNRRSTRDWVLDNIINTFHKDGSVFTLLDAAKILSTFEIQASFPNFFTNLDWYKNYTFNKNKSVDDLSKFWPRIELFLFDWRVKEIDLIKLSIEESIQATNLIESIFRSVHIVLNSELGGSETILRKFQSN